MEPEIQGLFSLTMLVLALGMLLLASISFRRGRMTRDFAVATTVCAAAGLLLAAAFRFAGGSLPLWMIVGSLLGVAGSVMMIRSIVLARRRTRRHGV